MNKFILLFCLVPFISFAQVKPNNNPTAKKTNPAVVKLVEQAYEEYQNSLDDACLKTIKKIQTLDPKNRDAFLLKANLAIFTNNYEEMWLNLNKIYNKNIKEADVYSNFVMSHINNFVLPDSIKAVLCRRSIKINSKIAEPFATLGMVAANSGYFEDAIVFFEISEDKIWKDEFSKPIIMLTHARCLYSANDVKGALEKATEVYNKATGNEKYTCLYLMTKYNMDLGNYDIQKDIDTLNFQAWDNIEVKKLNVEFLGKTNQKDSACKLAKVVRYSKDGENFDISPYCSDITNKINVFKYKSMIYSSNENDFFMNISDFKYPLNIDFKWKRLNEFGSVKMKRLALDSAYFQNNYYVNKTNNVQENEISFWLSKAQFCELESNDVTKISVDNSNLRIFKVVGKEQIEVFDENNDDFLLDCVIISDGQTVISYLNDVNNPLIVRIQSEKIDFLLTKIE